MDARTDPAIEALVAAFYAAFDNRDSRRVTLEALRSTFAEGATITRVTPDRVDCWTPEAFIAPRAQMLSDGTLEAFHEWETSAHTTIFENIASRTSTYEKSGVLNGADFRGRGRKFVQLHRSGGRWYITSVLWEDD